MTPSFRLSAMTVMLMSLTAVSCADGLGAGPVAKLLALLGGGVFGWLCARDDIRDIEYAAKQRVMRDVGGDYEEREIEL